MADSTLSINIGIDFGTSYTKVCVQADDTEKSEIVTFNNSSLEGAILLTKVGISRGGQLLAGVTEKEWDRQAEADFTEVEYIKMRLADLDLAHEGTWFQFRDLSSFQKNNLNTSENIENLCAYFLGTVLARTKAWFPQRHPERVKNRKLVWSANIGVPVRYYNSAALVRFEKVLRLAWLISTVPALETFTLDKLTQVAIDFREQLDQEFPCFAVPEVAAGTYAYTASRTAQPGDYVFIDVGSGTIESVSFHFLRESGSAKLDFIAPYVYPLGVDALAEGLSKASGSKRSEIKDAIVGKSQVNIVEQVQALIPRTATPLNRKDYVAAVSGEVRISQQSIERLLSVETVEQPFNTASNKQLLLELMLWQMAIHLQVAKVVKISSVPTIIFLGGGGGETEFYRHTIEATHSAFKQKDALVPPYVINSIPAPASQDFTMNGIDTKHFHRFGIAYGLSIPYLEMPEFRLPGNDFSGGSPTHPNVPRYPEDSSQIEALLESREIFRIAETIRQDKSYNAKDYSSFDDWRDSPNRALGGRVQS